MRLLRLLARIVPAVVGLAVPVAASNPVHAQVLVSSLSNGSNSGFFQGSNLGYPTIAQQFTLTSDAQVATIDARLATLGTTPAAASALSFRIVDDNGNSVGTTVEGTTTGLVSGTLNSQFNTLQYTFGASPLALSAGTYWVEMLGGTTSGSNSAIIWQTQTSYSTTGSDGTINQRSFHSTSTYSTTTLAVALNGTFAAVPEAGSMHLAAILTAAAAPVSFARLLRRRR